MNKSRFQVMRPLLMNAFGGRADPFNNPTGENIFNKQAERKQQQSERMPPAGATDWVPSSAVPGQSVRGTPSQGEGGQLGHRASNTAQSPLASYMGDDYYEPSGQEGGQGQGAGKPSTPAEAPPKGVFDADLSDFQNVIQSQQFTSEADAEVAGRALKGDASALMELLNSVSRKAVASSAYLSTQVAKRGVNAELDTYGKKLPAQLAERQFETMFQGKQEGVLADPRTSSMAELVRDKFRKEFPNASPERIKSATIAYLEDMSGYKNKQSQAADERKSSEGQSWGNFFNQ